MAPILDEIKQYFQARSDRFGEPYRHIGNGRDGKEFAELPRPDEYVATPAGMLEAAGFYFLNVLKRDNGSVYTFETDAGATHLFCVLATSDGRDAHLEVYGANGEILAAAIIDRAAPAMNWTDRDAVRYHAGIEGFQ